MYQPPYSSSDQPESTPAAGAATPLRLTQTERPAAAHESADPPALSEQHLNRLRQLRAEVRDLQAIIERVQIGEASLDDYRGYIARSLADAKVILAEMTPLEHLVDYGDIVRHMLNLVEQMGCCTPLVEHGVEITTEQRLRYLDMLNSLSRELIFQIGLLTIPSRIQSWLHYARPGYYIPFHVVFEDELPNPEDRKKLLDFLSWQPGSLPGGLVDAGTGLIYKYSTSDTWKAISALILVAAVEWIVVALLHGPYYAAQLGLISGLPPSGNSYLGLWIAVVAGVVFHTMVAVTKRARLQPDRPPILALGTLFPLINAKIGAILYKLALTLVGLIAILTIGGSEQATSINAFLVGYSLDSIIELFGTRAEQQAAAYSAAMKSRLGAGNLV